MDPLLAALVVPGLLPFLRLVEPLLPPFDSLLHHPGFQCGGLHRPLSSGRWSQLQLPSFFWYRSRHASAEVGVLVLTFIDQKIAHVRLEKRQSNDSSSLSLSNEEIMSAVHSGTSERVRPIVMTASAIIAGLLPIMWSHGTGSEVMQRIEAPMIGGMVTATILSLLVLPIIYGLVLQFKERIKQNKVEDT